MELRKNILKIEREFGEFDKVKFTFRYLGVNEKERIFIQKELADLELKTNKIENEVYVINFPLTDEIESERVKTINEKLELPLTKFGISVSFTTNYDHAGFRLPKKIREFYQIVGGEFDCSIIMIEENV
ncbi:hypothetical protein ESY87_19460 [Subsaximicrobium wynnwilliamsii]|uniref:hypothetical protein n=1 Tax=Subsaximicrobium wynnwilliamsii TaxID=291179 RepID=UPI0011BD9F4E|nr:hypothetical protein [Subsaximicrobium wynnwilliamsii]TXD80699.1 hypothetical protein ESY87_20355 [Subsaximicrobium wynnwilliamsii]TXD81068.1 hypothetical protein ESY87_19460 [Subsaximicrobium wynnwilliamsii]TXD99922.1 hypothetical protein ESY88_20300 [Subsaximicrobium wynnwilliamsii]